MIDRLDALLDVAGGSARRRLLLALIGELLEAGDEPAVEASVVPIRSMASVPTNEELLAGVRLEQERRGVLPNSIYVRNLVVRKFMAHMMPKNVLEAERQDIELWLDSRGVKPTTRRNYLVHLDRFYVWTVDEGYIDQAPTRGIVKPRVRRRLPRPIADEDLVRALDPANIWPGRPGRRLRCFLTLGAFAGLRVQEMAGLHVADVDRDGGMLRIRAGKGEKERILPLHPDVLAALDALPMPAGGAVFLNRGTGEPLPPWCPSHTVGRYFRELGIPSTAHCLRHWFATKCYRADGDLRLTQELLGHSSPATTAIYAAFDPARAGPTVAGLGIG